MSITAGIDFSLSESIRADELMVIFDRDSWDFSYEGLALFLSPACYEDMDWVVVEPASADRLMEKISEIQGSEGGFGFSAVHNGSGVGGQFLVEPGGKKITWNITVNRPYISESERLVDYTLCLRAAWEAIGKLREKIVCIQFMQSL